MPEMSLADQQAALVAALAAEGPVPAGFDPARLRAAAAALAFKRARAVAHAWPSLRAMLGGDVRETFAAYAAVAPLPARGGPLADGRRFARFIARQLDLSDAARMQALSIDARYRETAAGLVRRRVPTLRATWLRNRRSVMIAVGEHRYRLQWPLRLGR